MCTGYVQIVEAVKQRGGARAAEPAHGRPTTHTSARARAARKRRATWQAAAASSTTWCCRGCCTPASCAARTRTRGSYPSTATNGRNGCRRVRGVLTPEDVKRLSRPFKPGRYAAGPARPDSGVRVRRRQGAIRRRAGGDGRGRHARRGRGRARADRGRVRAAAGSRQPRGGGGRGRAAHLRGAGEQRRLAGAGVVRRRRRGFRSGPTASSARTCRFTATARRRSSRLPASPSTRRSA